MIVGTGRMNQDSHLVCTTRCKAAQVFNTALAMLMDAVVYMLAPKEHQAMLCWSRCCCVVLFTCRRMHVNTCVLFDGSHSGSPPPSLASIHSYLLGCDNKGGSMHHDSHLVFTTRCKAAQVFNTALAMLMDAVV